MDFPRIPLPRERATFAALAAQGAALVDLHLLRLPGSRGMGGAGGAALLVDPTAQGVHFAGRGNNRVELVRYVDPEGVQPGYVAINASQRTEGVEPATWQMHVGGYHPLRTWLKERDGRVLSSAEVLPALRVVVALRETRRIMAEIEGICTIVQ